MNQDQKYKVTARRDSHNYALYNTYRGEPAAVVQAVATSIRACHVDQCYEHMLTRVYKVTLLPDNQLEVVTYTNEYAGD